MGWQRIVRRFRELLDVVVSGLGAGDDGDSVALTYNHSAQTFTATVDPRFDSLRLTDTTASTSTTTGAFQLPGIGMGDGNIYNSGVLNGLVVKSSGTGQIIGDSTTAPNASGSNWIAQGLSAANSKTTGNNWIAQGLNAGKSNTTGSTWLAQGVNAGFSSTIGSTWIAQGVSAGFSNTTGNNWIAQGFNAGRSNTTGNNWLAQGVSAGFSNTTGSNWIAQGLNAANGNTTGNNWLAQGSSAGFSNTTGSTWVAQGFEAGFSNETGSNWLAAGGQAGRNCAAGITGFVFLGYRAGYTETNSNTLHIGNNSSSSLLHGRFDNNTLMIGSPSLETPTAACDLAASTTTRASLRIRAGVAPTTPQDGDIWNDGSDLKVRLGGVTYTLQKA